MEYKINKNWRETASKKMMYEATSRSKQYDYPINITFEDIEIPEKCPILGLTLKPAWGTGVASDSSPSLDRIIPELGYTKGNIQVLSARANNLKRDGCAEEHRLIYEYISNIFKEETNEKI